MSRHEHKKLSPLLPYVLLDWPRILGTDGSAKSIDALSELYILQEAASRRAFNMKSNLHGEDVHPSDMFEIMGALELAGKPTQSVMMQ